MMSICAVQCGEAVAVLRPGPNPNANMNLNLNSTLELNPNVKLSSNSSQKQNLLPPICCCWLIFQSFDLHTCLCVPEYLAQPKPER